MNKNIWDPETDDEAAANLIIEVAEEMQPIVEEIAEIWEEIQTLVEDDD